MGLTVAKIVPGGIEQAASEIMALPQPSAVILVGAHDMRYTANHVRLKELLHGHIPLRSIEDIEHSTLDGPVIFMLDMDQTLGADHKHRHETVQKLRAHGVQSIAMIYTKYNPKKDVYTIDPNERAVLAAVSKTLENDPPTVDGVELLFIDDTDC